MDAQRKPRFAQAREGTKASTSETLLPRLGSSILDPRNINTLMDLQSVSLMAQSSSVLASTGSHKRKSMIVQTVRDFCHAGLPKYTGILEILPYMQNAQFMSAKSIGYLLRDAGARAHGGLLND